MSRAPCKDCPDRFPACHDSCPRFKEYREYIDARNKAKAEEHAIYETMMEGMARVKKRRTKKGKV